MISLAPFLLNIMELSKIASAIYNDLQSGLTGFNANPAISLEQLEDECVEKRQAVIKEWYLKDVLKKGDFAISLSCIDVDCKNMLECNGCKEAIGVKMGNHFEIPLLMNELGDDAILYIGTADGTKPFKVYNSMISSSANKYRRRGNKEPYVFIDRTPNSNNKCDGWIFNAPFIKQIKVTAIFKDLRDLEEYSCCQSFDYLDFGAVSDEVKTRVKKDKLLFYRQNPIPPHQTDLMPR